MKRLSKNACGFYSYKCTGLTLTTFYKFIDEDRGRHSDPPATGQIQSRQRIPWQLQGGIKFKPDTIQWKASYGANACINTYDPADPTITDTQAETILIDTAQYKLTGDTPEYTKTQYAHPYQNPLEQTITGHKKYSPGFLLPQAIAHTLSPTVAIMPTISQTKVASMISQAAQKTSRYSLGGATAAATQHCDQQSGFYIGLPDASIPIHNWGQKIQLKWLSGQKIEGPVMYLVPAVYVEYSTIKWDKDFKMIEASSAPGSPVYRGTRTKKVWPQSMKTGTVSAGTGQSQWASASPTQAQQTAIKNKLLEDFDIQTPDSSYDNSIWLASVYWYLVRQHTGQKQQDVVRGKYKIKKSVVYNSTWCAGTNIPYVATWDVVTPLGSVSQYAVLNRFKKLNAIYTIQQPPCGIIFDSGGQSDAQTKRVANFASSSPANGFHFGRPQQTEQTPTGSTKAITTTTPSTYTLTFPYSSSIEPVDVAQKPAFIVVKPSEAEEKKSQGPQADPYWAKLYDVSPATAPYNAMLVANTVRNTETKVYSTITKMYPSSNTQAGGIYVFKPFNTESKTGPVDTGTLLVSADFITDGTQTQKKSGFVMWNGTSYKFTSAIVPADTSGIVQITVSAQGVPTIGAIKSDTDKGMMFYIPGDTATGTQNYIQTVQFQAAVTGIPYVQKSTETSKSGISKISTIQFDSASSAGLLAYGIDQQGSKKITSVSMPTANGPLYWNGTFNAVSISSSSIVIWQGGTTTSGTAVQIQSSNSGLLQLVVSGQSKTIYSDTIQTTGLAFIQSKPEGNHNIKGYSPGSGILVLDNSIPSQVIAKPTTDGLLQWNSGSFGTIAKPTTNGLLYWQSGIFNTAAFTGLVSLNSGIPQAASFTAGHIAYTTATTIGSYQLSTGDYVKAVSNTGQPAIKLSSYAFPVGLLYKPATNVQLTSVTVPANAYLIGISTTASGASINTVTLQQSATVMGTDTDGKFKTQTADQVVTFIHDTLRTKLLADETFQSEVRKLCLGGHGVGVVKVTNSTTGQITVLDVTTCNS